MSRFSQSMILMRIPLVTLWPLAPLSHRCPTRPCATQSGNNKLQVQGVEDTSIIQYATNPGPIDFSRLHSCILRSTEGGS
ncbi:hypothetical protein F4778DRAFT_276262 [Xylariomycetidae sp. FL2044]|nr:hypothetical protein F4778DRAFT_276262 [Xylariomycetidae sp. FL2044]